jgi:outer membrane protein OmpA-like peptidoglycan-associated protein
MCRRVVWLVSAILFSSGAWTAAQEKYASPDDPRIHAVAREALPGARIVDIVVKVGGIEGLIQDLNAKVTTREIVIDLPGDVLFDFDKWSIRRDAETTLDKVASIVNAHTRSRVHIDGHTDAKGDMVYNQQLSERRAAAIKDWLVAHGANSANLGTHGWGKTKLIAPNALPDGGDNPEGRQKNRRVELRIQK